MTPAETGALATGETVEVPTAEAMRTLAAQIAATAGEVKVIALYGDLGAGKTEFAKGFVTKCGVSDDQVTSPTFTLLHEYEGGRVPIYHFDAYRAKYADELVEIGLDEYLFGDGICLVEWPEIIEHLLPDQTLRLRIEHGEAESRRVTRIS